MNNSALDYIDNELYCEGVSFGSLAREYGTPLFVYSANSFRERIEKLDRAFGDYPHRICYSVKTCSNVSILKRMSQMGCGFDIVSGGELFRVQKAGADTSKVVFAGVGKTSSEIFQAIQADIMFFSVESVGELERINNVAEGAGKTANVAIRVNPDVDPQTHKYISTGKRENKFGVDFEVAMGLYEVAKKLPSINAVGVQCHIGSQILSTDPHATALGKVVDFVGRLKDQLDVNLEFLDIGGGFGIKYQPDDQSLDIDAVISRLVEIAKPTGLTLVIEPGRYIAGPSGFFVTRVEYVKYSGEKKFLIVDAGMNDLLRPSLYSAYHHVVAVKDQHRSSTVSSVVGPICESGDFIALDRELTDVEQGELLVVEDSGAYGFSMSSNYNSRPRCAEVLVDDDKVNLISRRQSYDDLIRDEIIN